MKIKVQYLLLCLILTSYTLNAQVKQQAGIKQFLNLPGLKHASVGICVKDMSGKLISGHNTNKAYTPASILKLVTTATALELLGADYRYQTTLSKDKNNENRLFVHGYGDPTLGSKHLNNQPDTFLSQWSKKIKQNMDSATAIDITVVDNYFGYDGVSQRWLYQDLGNAYAAAAYGVSIFDNTYYVYFNTTRSDTCPVIVKTVPEMNISFLNTLSTNKTGQDNAYIHGEPFSTNRTLTGDIPAGKTSFGVKGDIPNPGLYLGEVLGRELADNGFEINSIESTYNLYYDEMHLKERTNFPEGVFHTHYSLPLRDIIKDTNVRSNNHYAEHLIRSVGRTKNADIYSSALRTGIEKVNELWKARGLNTASLTMFDGSGLSPSNAVSPSFVCDLLVYMQAKSKNAKTFLESLPKAGKDGTVRNRLKGTRLAGKISMKSGSIFGVQCFAGYYIDGDKKYAFTIMVNKFNGQRSQITKGIDDLLLSLF